MEKEPFPTKARGLRPARAEVGVHKTYFSNSMRAKLHLKEGELGGTAFQAGGQRLACANARQSQATACIQGRWSWVPGPIPLSQTVLDSFCLFIFLFPLASPLYTSQVVKK